MGSELLRARVSEEGSRLLREDIETLGLAGIPEAIREGLTLLHHKAQMVALGRAYDDFVDDQPASVSGVTAALFPDIN